MDAAEAPTASITVGTVVSQSPDTAAAFITGEADPTTAVLANLRAHTAAVVSVSAVAVWEHADDGRPVAGVIDDLAEMFRVDRPTVERDVLDAVDQLVRLGYLTIVEAEKVDAGPTGRTPCATGELVSAEPGGRRHWTVPASSCQHNVDNLGWHATTAIRVGSIDVGVRTNDAWATDIVRRAFAPHVVSDSAAPPNYSAVLAPLGTDPAPPHRRFGLFEGHRWFETAPHPDAVVALLAMHLSAWPPTPIGHVRLELQAVCGDTGIVLAPAPPAAVANAVTAMANSRQWSTTPSPVAVNVTDRSLASATISTGAPSAAPQPSARPMLPVAAVVVVGDELARLEPAAALAALAPSLRLAPDDDADTVLHAAADLASRLTVLSAPAADLADVVAGLARHR